MRHRILASLTLLAACAQDADPKTVVVDSGQTAPADPLADEYALPDDAWPESVAWDPETRQFFTSSLARGDVTAIASDGTVSTFAPGDGAAGRATVGVEVDADRRRLWACAILADGSAPAELWAYDLDTGEQLAAMALGDALPGASCTDVTFDAGGVAYATDRENAAIYRADLDEGSATLWSEAEALAPGVIGSNGAVFSPDGQWLVVTKYLPASLVRISVADPADAVEIALAGDPFEGGSGLNGADDVVLLDGKLYVTLVDRLMTVTPDDDSWASATVAAAEIEDGGTTGLVVADGRIFAANGQAVEFTFGQEPAPFWIRSVGP